MEQRAVTEQLKKTLQEFFPDGLPSELLASVASVDSSTDELSLGGMSLSVLREEALSCTKCRLADTRKNVVFGVGNTKDPRIVFVGEGPGADEDRTGEPFVGKAGQLLTAAIEKGLKLKRQDVYICNVVKCRPPENRTPMADEVESCVPYLHQQLRLLKPEVIVTLGQPAQLALSGIQMGITKLRGRWQSWEGIPLLPTFHPAYILRTPSAKKDFWKDLQAVMKHLGMDNVLDS